MDLLNAAVKSRALEAVKVLAREAQVRAAYIFGSQAADRGDQWSDLDLAAFVEGAEIWDPWQKTRIIVQVQKEVGFDVDTHIFPASALENPEASSFAAEIIRHGVRIF